MALRYTVMPKEDSIEVRRAIRRVFNEIGDSIRVMEDPEWPRDEYDGYIGKVFELLVPSGSDKQIEDYLEDATAGMGMDRSLVNREAVIEALCAIPWSSKPQPQSK